MRKFEYLVEVDIYENELNKLGLEGWELVCIQRDYITSSHHYYFKREITA